MTGRYLSAFKSGYAETPLLQHFFLDRVIRQWFELMTDVDLRDRDEDDGDERITESEHSFI
jgi:hypothetical protein